jgi:hypothetical protein
MSSLDRMFPNEAYVLARIAGCSFRNDPLVTLTTAGVSARILRPECNTPELICPLLREVTTPLEVARASRLVERFGKVLFGSF